MNFEEKIEALKAGGLDKLHVICDFDRTMTTFAKGGSSFSPVRRLGFMPEEYGEQALALFANYHPMELDNKIPHEEKEQLMHEWWEAQLLLMMNHGLKKQHLEQVNGSNIVKLREGIIEFMNDLAARGIPLLVLSAGFGDVIEIVLKEAGVYTDNVHVVSNFLEYDEDGKAVAYRAPIVHGMNKCEQELGPYEKDVVDRPNVILVGDMVGDGNMADGLVHDTVLKIAFHNGDDEGQAKDLEEVFDHVIKDDESWEGVNEVWRRLTEE